MMPRWLVTTLRLTPIVALTSLLSAVGLVGFRAVVAIDDLRQSSNEVGNYLQTLGGIYAVLLAFVVYVVWGQFNEARGLVDREAAALVDLHRTASGLPVVSRVAIQKGLREYVDAVIDLEWKAMAARDEAMLEKVGERLDEVWVAIHCCRPVTDSQHTVYSEILSRFNDLMDIRTSRLTSARARIPQAMRVLLFTGAFLTICSMYLLAIDRLWIHAIITAALAGAIAHVLFLIVDLDDAFAGDLQVARAPFERARRNFGRAIHLCDGDAVAAQC